MIILWFNAWNFRQPNLQLCVYLVATIPFCIVRIQSGNNGITDNFILLSLTLPTRWRRPSFSYTSINLDLLPLVLLHQLFSYIIIHTTYLPDTYHYHSFWVWTKNQKTFHSTKFQPNILK